MFRSTPPRSRRDRPSDAAAAPRRRPKQGRNKQRGFIAQTGFKQRTVQHATAFAQGIEHLTLPKQSQHRMQIDICRRTTSVRHIGTRRGGNGMTSVPVDCSAATRSAALESSILGHKKRPRTQCFRGLWNPQRTIQNHPQRLTDDFAIESRTVSCGSSASTVGTNQDRITCRPQLMGFLPRGPAGQPAGPNHRVRRRLWCDSSIEKSPL